MGTDWRVEERLREKLALLSQELSETLAALDAVRADLAAAEKAREEAERERDAISAGLDTALSRFDSVLSAHLGNIRERESGNVTTVELPSMTWPDAVGVVLAHLERERDEARDSIGKAAALAMIPLQRGEHFRDVPETQPHAAIARIREDLNECRAERDAAIEACRDEAWKARNAETHLDESTRYASRLLDRALAAESRAARLEEQAKKTRPLLCFALGFIGSIVECKDARFATSLPHLAQWTEEAGAAIAAEEGK